MEIDGIHYFVIYVIHEIGYTGCSISFEQRKKQHKRNHGDHILIEVLELIPTALGPEFAGDQEWYYADSFGYPRGRHYTTTWNYNLTSEQRSQIGEIGVQAQLEKGIHNSQTKKSGWYTGAGGRVGGKASVKSQLEKGIHNSQTGKNNKFASGEAQKIASASPNHPNNRKKYCPDCDKMIHFPAFNRHVKARHGLCVELVEDPVIVDNLLCRDR
jgi:hypothetical protein